MIHHITAHVLTIGALAIITTGLPAAEPDADYFPSAESEGGWRKLNSVQEIRETGGMDPQKLEELKQWLMLSDKRDFAAVVIRHGHVVLEVERGNSATSPTKFGISSGRNWAVHEHSWNRCHSGKWIRTTNW